MQAILRRFEKDLERDGQIIIQSVNECQAQQNEGMRRSEQYLRGNRSHNIYHTPYKKSGVKN